MKPAVCLVLSPYDRQAHSLGPVWMPGDRAGSNSLLPNVHCVHQKFWLGPHSAPCTSFSARGTSARDRVDGCNPARMRVRSLAVCPSSELTFALCRITPNPTLTGNTSARG